MEVKLTGPSAIIGAIIIVLFIGYKYNAAATTLDTEGKEVIQFWLASEYNRHHLARSDLSKSELTELLLIGSQVELSSLSGRGSVDNLAVRVEIEPNKAHPDGMSYTQYYRLKYSTLTGWQYVRDISSLQYHLSMF